MSIDIHAIEYHRNGISGEGFYACHFTDPEEGRDFIATVFPPPAIPSGEMEGEPDWLCQHHMPRVAVLALDLLPSVEFGVNSWRGDNYASELYHAIMEGIGARA